MTLLPLFEWLEATRIGEVIRDSTWIFPVIESFHLVAFSAIGGSILIVDFRLLGVFMQRWSVAEIADEAQPWFTRSLAVMWVSGVLLFLSEAVKCYYSVPFWIKLGCLAGAIAFATSVRRRVILKISNGSLAPGWGKVAGLVSLALWSAVAWGGRWIGFSG